MPTTPRAVPTNRIALVVGVCDDGNPGTAISPSAADAFAAILGELTRTCAHTPLVVLARAGSSAGRLALEIAVERNHAAVACVPAEGDGAPVYPIDVARYGRIDVAGVDGDAAYVAAFGDALVTFAAGDAEPSFALAPSDDAADARARIDRYNADLEREDANVRAGTTIDALCVLTSEIASRLQSVTFRYLYILYAIAIVATAAQYTTNQLFKFAMVPITFIAYRIARRFDFENRYQDYRALAEGLRVQAAWFASGLDAEQSDRSYLEMQERELHWIRAALRYAYFAFRRTEATAERGPAGSRTWVAGQLAYFASSARREARRLADLNRLSRAALWSALVACVAIVAILNVPPAWSTGWLGSLRSWSIAPGPHGWLVRLSTGVFALYAALALLISNYIEKRGFAVNVKRYERMFVVFERARARLDALAPGDDATAREIVRELGRAALIENGDWLLTRREKPRAFVL